MPEMPFGAAEFFAVFRDYHVSFPLAPAIWTGLALVLLVALVRRPVRADRFAAAFLAALWVWTGVAYHLMHFTAVNPAAYLFGALFVVQGLLFARAGVMRSELSFKWRRDRAVTAGTALIVYALLLYPLFAMVFGHGYPAAPSFGVPCPTTIFTFGLLLWTVDRVPKHLLVMPLLWSLFAAPTAIRWGVFEDVMMPIAAVLATALLLLPRRGPSVDAERRLHEVARETKTESAISSR